MGEKKEKEKLKDDLKMNRQELAAYLRTIPDNVFLRIRFGEEDDDARE